MHNKLLFPFLLFPLLHLIQAQAPRPNGEGTVILDPLEPGEPKFKRADNLPCDPHFRSLDGTCTNSRHKLWGSVSMPHYSYLRHASSKRPTGHDLPSARYISNILCPQSRDIHSKRRLTELVTFFGQFLDHNLVATPVTPGDNMNIPIPKDDPVFANFSGALPFQRSVRGMVEARQQDERPINTLSSAVDLAAIYGSDSVRTNALRAFKHGKLQTSHRNLLQINDVGLRNAPTNDDKFYLSGDHRANEHPILTSFHTLFVREHNRLCEELKHAFPHWSDDDLFKVARKINGAVFQKIVYTEFIPAMTGRHLPRYTGFKPWVNPTVSDIFSTAAFRVGHTMVGNGIHRRGKGMRPMKGFRMQEMFFRPKDVMKRGIEPFFRGAIYHKAQEIDMFVHDSLRNFLFTGIPEEKGFDLVALNIQRGRDHALPSFNEIRKLFGLKPARKFKQISRNRAVQSALATAYGSVDKVEAWVGMVAEDHVRGGSMGKTMLRVWKAEFLRLRDGDRFFYHTWNLFPYEMYRKMPHLRGMLFGKESLREIILRNTKITEKEIGKSVWRRKGNKNKDKAKKKKDKKKKKKFKKALRKKFDFGRRFRSNRRDAQL